MKKQKTAPPSNWWRNNPVPAYLMACYAYEILAHPIMTDAEFDKLGSYLHDFWDLFDHPHKVYIEEDACHYTSALTVPYADLPLIALSATHAMVGSSLRDSPIYADIMRSLAARDLV